ncbi:nucleotide-diphospho-sugar transferases [Lucifera butyrica]|uniref:Nucleotide-diphospho-sugar transferases n=1 Tax=Lucifera butyrica TaxID=1351585 RepID=A0A498RDL7_9FIRM|nr:glycosyltransferase [Lucifera butyrica]VBB09419.1 nucleotide-diphospho-sugar transferases [Lucifera butyrica]
MFFSYAVSIVLLSLAMYGLWCLGREFWQWSVSPRSSSGWSISFLLVIHNLENHIESILRTLMADIEYRDITADIVIVDRGSTDLTPLLLDRLAGEFPQITVYYLPEAAKPVADALPLCRGSVVHVFDLVNRLKSEEFTAAANSLLRQY